jgi:8-oxo-dGTP pyrophosphatase MutT (NUDIX family)
MVKVGCGILFYHPGKKAVLVFRRDDKSWIPFPNMLDILGGGVEDGESPSSAIIREMAEELIDRRTGRPYVLEGHKHFITYSDIRGCEQNIYDIDIDFEIDDLELLEGRALGWLHKEDIESGLKLAFEFEGVLEFYFQSRSTP